MRTALIFIGTAVVGGIAFWVPSVVLHAIRSDRFYGTDVVALTVLPLLVAIAVTFVADFITNRTVRATSTPLAVALGVWILGPLAMFLSATPSGGGFATQGSWIEVLALTAMFPLTTFMLAT